MSIGPTLGLAIALGCVMYLGTFALGHALIYRRQRRRVGDIGQRVIESLHGQGRRHCSTTGRPAVGENHGG